MNNPERDNKEKLPLFTPRENGSGWDLNIGSKVSYIIVAIILAIPFIVAVICFFMVKHK
jgi:uncharacterized membrane protein